MRTINSAWITRGAGLCVMAGVTATLLLPNRADACGGTFCDALPPPMPNEPMPVEPMPVDQTGESVIFVMGGDKAEVHIQISIDPNTSAQKFAWLIPLTNVPDFTVGSQPFFNQVLNGTVPTYSISSTYEQCGSVTSGGGGGGDGCGGESTSGDEPGGETGVGDDGTTGDLGPQILLQETVGAFDVVVLTDTELAPIQMWLEDNGYNWDPVAGPILEQYLAEGNVIAALKLTTGAGLADVHPITLRYDGLETCFPLRLTRIAAVEDMDIRVFVLASERAAPTNYKHVLVNPLKIDWLNLASNYKEVISHAVDADMAGGRAFVTEYAGTSDAVDRTGIHSNSWDEQAFVGLDPSDVIQVLNAQGLSACNFKLYCVWNHPLVYGLLLEFLPPPDGVDPLEFYAELGSYAGDIDVIKWNMGAEFSAAMRERIVEPGLAALLLLDTWPYLTRMYTTISPAEMMEDPIFHTNPDLGAVANFRTASQYVRCIGDSEVTLPDGRQVQVPGGVTWPNIPGEVWWEEEVQTIALKGAPMTLVNNTAAINKALDDWNQSHRSHDGARQRGRACGDETSYGGYESSGLDSKDSGCGCTTGGSQLPGLLAPVLLLLRRRRR